MQLSFSRKKIEHFKVNSNSAEAFKLNITKKKILEIDTFLKCENESFIPIYLTFSQNKKNSFITVEHTHPPSDLFWGLKKSFFGKMLKNNWLYKKHD